jgi:hypothetical protein
VIVVAESVAVGVTVTDAIEFTACAVYVIVEDAKAGVSAPDSGVIALELNTRLLRVASVLSVADLVTVMEYVLVVVPSPAVTTTSIAVFAPTAMACDDDAAPDAVEDPPTVNDAPLSSSVGVMVMDDTAFTTVAVYAVVPDANAGFREPELSTNDVRSTSTFTDAVLVTAT